MTKPLPRTPKFTPGYLPYLWALPILCLLHSGVANAAAQTGAACLAGDRQPHVQVVVTGVRRKAGNVTFTLYGDERAKFLAHHGSLSVIRVPLTGLDAEACFAVSRPGTYAVAVYHDENDNHHFDRTLLGLPAEGYGFSNNVKPLFGLPGFDSVTFPVGPAQTRIDITLIY